MATASQILTRATAILKVDSSSVGVPGLEETQLLAMLNAFNAEYTEAFKKGGGEPPDFMRQETGGTLVSDTALNGAITTASTSVIVDDGTDFDSAGAIVVWDGDMPDVIYYTGKSSNTFSGATGIGFAHEDDDGVQKLYALPSNFLDLRQQTGMGEGVSVNGKLYDYTSGAPFGTQFSLVTDGTTTYFWPGRGSSGDYSIFYNKKSTTIDDTADVVDIPDGLPYEQFFLVYRLVAYGRRILGSNADRIQEADAFANRILSDALKKRYVAKRPRLLRSAQALNAAAGGHTSGEFFNTRTGTYGYNL